MSLYRIYIDETGNHDMTHADDPNQRFLALTGVILEVENQAENRQYRRSATGGPDLSSFSKGNLVGASLNRR
jgi:hypothetical protein